MQDQDMWLKLFLAASGGALLGYWLQRRKNVDSLEAGRTACQNMNSYKREMLPQRIILVRHGESEGNADHTLYRTKPDNAIELTDKGSEEAVAVGKRIKELIGPDSKVHIFVSPFERTLQTCRNLRQALSGQIQHTYVDPRIREQEFGNMQGEDFHKLREQQKEVGRFWYRFPTGESGADVFDRVKQWFEHSVACINVRPGFEPVDTVIVVTHGLTMRLILMQLYGWSVTTFHSVWNASNCSMYVLKKDTSLPGSCPYALCAKDGDMPKASIALDLTLTDGSKLPNVTLQNYLDVPAPRTHNFEVVKRMLAEQHKDLAADSIAHIDFHQGKFSKER